MGSGLVLGGVFSNSWSDNEVGRAGAQVSDQAVRLWQEGWFQTQAEPSGVLSLRNPKAPPPCIQTQRHPVRLPPH